MPSFSAANYVVAFHDIMGQSALLQKWNDKDKLTSGVPEVLDAFKKTTNRVWDIRHDFRTLIETFAKTGIDFSKLDLPVEIMDELRELDRFEIRQQSFSDTNIWFTDAHTNSGYVHAKRVLYLFFGLAGVHLTQLIRKIPCRGAVSFGAGTTDLFEGVEDQVSGEIYGPVLESAYRLESAVADYCRIVIHDDLVNFLIDSKVDLDTFVVGTADYMAGTGNNWVLDQCEQMITIDSDGAYVLDFAGEFVANRLAGVFERNGMNRASVFNIVVGFAAESQEEFATKRNFKLADRYAKLRGYLESRRHFWISS